ncbi:MAG: threonine--tRNA ligase [Thermoplasmata archaeon]|nr:MAG: threonine--tRNA ligase [Thermoplasmata archaeon]
MRMLLIHADFFEYEAKEPIKGLAEQIPEGKSKKERIEETLVVFTAVEKGDDSEPELIDRAATEIKGVADSVHTDKVVLYPYAHLSHNLAAPSAATSVMVELESFVKAEGLDVHRSPFGWYKSFDISCKGHPLSESSRELHPGEEVEVKAKTREEIVKDIESEFYILTPDARELPLDLDNIDKIEDLEKWPSLKTFILSEEIGKKKSKEPPSIKAMQRLELVDYEQASDSGHFKFFPKGRLIFDLLKEWAGQGAGKLDCIQIDTPILYDWSLPDIRGQGQSFHERHYMVHPPEEKREFVLRFAGDFGLFRMMKDANISYRHMPIRIYEFSKSFRMEQRGELSGLKRLRGFHMPDIHSFARDMEEAWKEYEAIFLNYTEFANGTNCEYAVAFRIEKEFYEQAKEPLMNLLMAIQRPALVEVLSGRKHYWVIKLEFQGIDSVGGCCQLSTVQIDVEDAERYGITYTDKDGENKGCIICHCSIGSIERWIYSLLEDALKKEKPELPFWLSPTQLRLIPVSPDYVNDCEKIAGALPGRIDVDDRDLNVGKKIREAEREWINLIVVYGEKEQQSGKLPVRLRSGEIKELGLKELKYEIDAGLKGYPYEKLPLPMKLSRRVIFKG